MSAGCNSASPRAYKTTPLFRCIGTIACTAPCSPLPACPYTSTVPGPASRPSPRFKLVWGHCGEVIVGKPERHRIVDWLDDPDTFRWLVELLNRSLNKLTGRRGLHLDKDHHRYYFAMAEPREPRYETYRPLNTSKATRAVVWQPVRKQTGEPRKHWYHRAVALRFTRIGNADWCLSIRPELRVTTDGVKPLESHAIGPRVTHEKSRLFNYDLLAEVQFWRDFLSDSSTRIVFPFGHSTQRIVVLTDLMHGTVNWPGIPEEHSMPFRNVSYVDDLTEPFLLFGEGGLHVDPKSGIDRYGPRSYGTSLHPRNVRVGIIGTAELSEIAQSWTARNAVGVAGDETNRSFPGFAPDRGFFSSLGFDDGWNATVSQTEMAGVIGIRSQRDRFGEAVKLIEGKLSLIAERDQPPDYVAIVISEELLQRCGVADYFDKAKGAVHRDFG